MDFLISSFHQGTLGLYDIHGEHLIESLAVSTMIEVKFFTTGFMFSFEEVGSFRIFCSISEEKCSQLSFFIFQCGG